MSSDHRSPSVERPNQAILWVRYLELADKVGDLDRIQRATQALRDHLEILPAPAGLRLLRVSKDLSDGAFAASVLTACFAQDRIDGTQALECLQWACATLDHQRAQAVERCIAAKIEPAARVEFDITARRLLDGPEAAYSLARVAYARAHNAKEAIRLAKAVAETGRTPLATRYLRWAARRWPQDMRLQDALFRACLSSGDMARASDLLSKLNPYLSNPQKRARTLDLLKAAGRFDEAWCAHQALERQDTRYAKSFECLRMNVFFGEVRDFRRLGYAVMAKHRHHLRATFLGSVADEKRICDASRADVTAQEVTRHDVTSYYHPAAEILRCLPRGLPDQEAAQSDRVRRIYQYWDKPDVPEMVGHIMQSWQRIDGWSYQRFNRGDALAWLAQTFDSKHARAFRTARRAAEQADFLRLCLLEVQGGLYADADDRLTGAPDALLSGTRGAVFFFETFGCLSNNVLYAPPGHVVIKTAREMACAALLRRDNDKVWLKTGPGLLTRALAGCVMDGLLINTADPTKAVTLLPNDRLKRHVAPHIRLPYKQTDQNWAHSATSISREVVAAWDALLM